MSDTEYIKEAMELLSGPTVAIEPAAPMLVRDEQGEYHTMETTAWVKLGIAFRPMIRELRGARLAVFICLCLHVNEKGTAWPSLETMSGETGYTVNIVRSAIRRLEKMGLITTSQRKGITPVYRPVFVSYGKKDPSQKVVPLTKSEPPPLTKSRLPPSQKVNPEEEPIEEPKKEEPKLTRKREPADPRSSHPVILAMKETLGRFPRKETWDMLIGAIGSEARIDDLKTCFAAWSAKGYNPNNLNWALDWYINGIPVATQPRNGNGKHSPPDPAHPTDTPAQAVLRKMIERMEAENGD